jgi:hypothetical protein
MRERLNRRLTGFVVILRHVLLLAGKSSGDEKSSEGMNASMVAGQATVNVALLCVLAVILKRKERSSENKNGAEFIERNRR